MAVFVGEFSGKIPCGMERRMKKGTIDNYFACLVRFWRESESSSWRVTVEDPHTNQKKSFANPDEYWRFLQTFLVHPETDHTDQKRVNDE